MENKNVVLTASANVGVGLWTSICVACANVFGVRSDHYNAKLEYVMDLVKKKLKAQMDKYPGVQFSDFRIVQDGKLAYTATVIGFGCVDTETKAVVKESIEEHEEESIPVVEEDPELTAFVEEAIKNSLSEDFEEDPECKRINEEARYYFNKKKDYKKAFELFDKASSGSPRAKYNLGYFCYYLGKGTKKDKRKGLELIKQAANSGYKTAADTLKYLKSQ